MNNLPQGWELKTLGEVCNILDNMRKPINADEREQRLTQAKNKFPYYGVTGQVGYIDDYLCDFEAILLGEDGAPFLEPYKNKAYTVSGKYWVTNHAQILESKFSHLEKLSEFVENSLQDLKKLKSSFLNQAFKRELI